MRFSTLYHPRWTSYLLQREEVSELPAPDPTRPSSKPPEVPHSHPRPAPATTDTQLTPPVLMSDDDDESTPTSPSNPGMALMEQIQTKHLRPRKRRRIHREDLPEDLQRQVQFMSQFAVPSRQASAR